MKILNFTLSLSLVIAVSTLTGISEKGYQVPTDDNRLMAAYSPMQQNTETTLKTVYSCPMHPEESMDKPGKCPKCGMNLVKKEVVKEQYTCPMHPEILQNKPGKCPKCGMNLVKKEAANETYTCPMHSDVKQDKPGKCPKCGMTLVKKTAVK
jgi:hypothetical protein